MSFDINGYEILDNFISPQTLQHIKTDLANISTKEFKAGIRNTDKKYTSKFTQPSLA